MPPFSFFSANQLIFPYTYVALFIDSKSLFYEGPFLDAHDASFTDRKSLFYEGLIFVGIQYP